MAAAAVGREGSKAGARAAAAAAAVAANMGQVALDRVAAWGVGWARMQLGAAGVLRRTPFFLRRLRGVLSGGPISEALPGFAKFLVAL